MLNKKRNRINSVSSISSNTRAASKIKSSVDNKDLKAELADIIENEKDDFQILGISKHVADKLRAKNINSLFEVQKKVFTPIESGKNVICASLTGSGKTLSFVLPLLTRYKDSFKQSKPCILVMAPTRELSIQVGREFSDLNSDGFKFKTVMIYGGVSIEDQIYKLRAGCDIIVGTPGRIMDMIERNELTLKNIKACVLDEADKMLNMGFLENIEEIFGKIHMSRRHTQVCLISATIESWVKDVANRIMINKHDDTPNKENDLKPIFIDLVKDLGGRTPKTVQHLAVNSMKNDRVMTIADLSKFIL
jgi:superfamily II DNA/RNA helicase